MADDILSEEWRPVEGWPYEVSSLGRVRRATADMGRTRSGKILATFPRASGHIGVMLCQRGRIKNMQVHRLVCAAFHGPAPSPQHQVAHWNGDASDNKPGNLRWATPLENAADTVRLGRSRPGERCNLAVLRDEDAADMRRRAHSGEAVADIARSFNVSDQSVRRVLSRRTFSHIPD